ncbi:MAG: glycosyltransferase family 2 protein [Limisphaerales bacterium]
MAHPFQTPAGLLGRFAVIKPWPDVQAAEDEIIARLEITARSMGLECVVVDPEGHELEPPHRRLTRQDVDFIFSLHFETPKAYDLFSFVALWNPVRFYKEWGFQRFSRNLLTHDDFLSCSSTGADDHVRQLIQGGPERNLDWFTMYHSLSEPILEPSLGDGKIFYAGINWERLDKKKKGRHQDLLKALDQDGLLRIHGPRLFQGVNVWEGYQSYVGPIPFDGVSFIHEIARAGISLTLSSEAHIESELMSMRLFESLAAGVIILCDQNPFARRHFGDTLLYLDTSVPTEQVYAQIKAHLDWIRSHPEEALAKARAAQAIFKERFTLDRSLATIYGKLTERKQRLEALYTPSHPEQPAQLLLLLPSYSPEDLDALLESAGSQTHRHCQTVLLVDEGEYRENRDEVDRKLAAASRPVAVQPIGFYDRRTDGSCRQRLRLGAALAPVIESLPADAVFLVIAPNERLFSNHVTTLLKSLQADDSAPFAYSQSLLRHVWDGRTAYDEMGELNVALHRHLPTGFGRFLFRRSAVTPDQLAAMRHLDLQAMTPLLTGRNVGVHTRRATLLHRIQEPFVTGELVDLALEPGIAKNSRTVLDPLVHLKHVKPVPVHGGPGGKGPAPAGITFAAFLLLLQQRAQPNRPAVEALRRLRRVLLLQTWCAESALRAAEEAVVNSLRGEISADTTPLLDPGQCDSFIAYSVGLCHRAEGRELPALHAFSRALNGISSEHPLPYLVRVALTLVRIALNQGETTLARQILESVILKRQPGHAYARELLAQLDADQPIAAPVTAPAPHGSTRRDAPPAPLQGPPLVSAIVSTYNSERFLRGCLEDLEQQTLADRLEIIVVDTASPQNERAIVEEFQQRFGNLVYVRTEQRETVYGAWNRGIKIARGRYLTNANTDDRHRRDAFEVLARTLDQHPDTALVYADCAVTRTENDTFEAAHPVNHFRWLDFDPLALLEKGCFVGPQPMWRRDVHQQHGYFDDALVSAGDYEFWLRLAQSHRFLHVKETLGLYLESPTSVEHANQDRGRRETALARERHRKGILQAVDRAQAGASPKSPTPPRPSAAPLPPPPCAALGQLGEAREWVRKNQLPAAWSATLDQLKLRPFHPEAFLLLAEIAQAAGDSVNARRCAQQAAKLAPDWKAPRQFLKGRGSARPEWLTLPASLQAGVAPRLSVCLIVRNEERFLAQCLASVKALAPQIVVVDTGSTDRTIEIARELGAEVHSSAWNDDFSAARNAALEHATGDWILMLDADEELSGEGRDLLRKMLRHDTVLAWRLPIVDAGREHEGCSYVPRLFRNAPGVHFVGRIHEQAFGSLEARRTEWGLDNRLGQAKLIHHGYTTEITADRRKIERNLRLLERAVQDSPDDPNLLMNLGLELARSGQEVAALERYRQAYEQLSRLPVTRVVPELRETLLTQFCTRLMAARHFEEIVTVLASPLARAHDGLTASLHFAAGLAATELERFEIAANHFRQCLARRAKPALTPLNPAIRTVAPRHSLAVCLARAGDLQGARSVFQAALEEEPTARPLRFDYLDFLARNGQAVEALQECHRLVNADASDTQAWWKGGQIALSQPGFLEVALDWTEAAFAQHPSHDEILNQRAAALLLAGQCAEALRVWNRSGNPRDANAMAARVISENVTGRSAFAPADVDEAAVSREFIQWYRRLIEFGATGVVEQLNANLPGLERVLPTGARLLSAALAEAAD